MTNIEFSYEEYIDIREHLIKTIKECMTKDDKQFLLGVNSLEPRWSYYDFEQFPAIQWKLQNLTRLQSIDQKKFKKQFSELELILYD